jgi:(p)ppGpp synthase/HD superfamily hydrolase
MNLILKAAQFAALSHRGQIRKYNGAPYITHPMRVAGRAMMLPECDEAMACAAWLHDVIEDCGVTETMISQQIAARPASLVAELTNPSKQYPDLSRAERKAMDREHIAQASREARIIKLLDRIDNLNEMGGSDPQFRQTYHQESLLLLDVLQHTHGELESELRKLLR